MTQFPPINPRLPRLWHGADYSPEQWTPDIWQEDMRLMRLARCNVMSVGIFAWAALEPEEGCYRFEWLDDLLDLLTDMSLLLDQPVPFTLLLNAPTLVSTMIQVTHSLVHHELDAIPDILNTMPEASLRRYIEGVLREPSLEDQLCGCLTLAEQAQLFAMSVPQEIVHHLATWLQTYLSSRLRRDLLSG